MSGGGDPPKQEPPTGDPPKQDPPTETPEQKAARETKEAEAKQNDTKQTPYKVEELKFSDDFKIEPALAEEFTKLVNEEGIPRSLISKLIPLQEKVMKFQAEQLDKSWNDLATGWRDTIQKDADIGGTKLEGSMGLLSKAIDMYSAKMKLNAADVRQAFDSTGAGDNPAIVKLFVGMARDLVKEGDPVNPGSNSGDADVDLGAKIYKKGLQKAG